ncbi:zinc finger protein chinmo [Drosophila elegans]|uniref:zinc finger protein chinmo n=1 Tax=Drosophila elegans TaxID=30023 RepID=UPI0007E80A63|nr:zinc finger protein chinmo [Drosophila elegans]XP_017129479.1 zinc finger protein chinmo [Drosophila elegans]
MAAENYHLKWDSHLSYLNSSIATLYKNEKFADVVLYSSYNSSGIPSDIPTVGISAHKFILSASSQFFATMFETAPITNPNGVLYVVLPPDLSHRAIQILVQYMYSGEATVSNDILNEVLRGGEILKIRGLCRTSSSNVGGSGSVVTTSHHPHPLTGHLHPRESSAMYMSNGTRSALPPPPPPPPSTMSAQLQGDLYASKPGGSTRFAMDHHHLSSHHNHLNHHHPQQQQFRGLGVSVMPKDSPVIIKSPKMAAHTGLLTVASSSKLGISVNKEVAIDPEDKCCFAAPGQVDTQSHPPPPTSTTTTGGGGGGGGGTGAPASQPISICTEVGCSSCPMTTGPSAEQAETTLRRTEYEEQALRERNEVGLVFERRLRRESACERSRDYYESQHFEHVVPSRLAATPPPPQQPPHPPPTLRHPHNFLTIKQEPTDWSNNPPNAANASNNNNLEEGPLGSPKQPLDFKMSAVKLEVNRDRGTPSEENEEHTLRDYNNFKQLLVCEICQKSFEDTKMLVRHLGTHAGDPAGGTERNLLPSSASGSTATASSNLALRTVKTYVPKKRRRVSQQENNMDHDHVTLLCDLCSTSFDTPAEWVRHMNSQHTEIELAMFNSKKDGEQKGQQHQSATSSSSTVSTSQMQPKYPSSTATRPTQSQSLMLHKMSNINMDAVPAATTSLSPGATTSPNT